MTPPPTTAVYPPPPVFYPGWPVTPPVIVPPVIIPPVVPPCVEGVDEECTPEEPPVDAPEPGLFYLLIMGALTGWLYRRKAQHTA